MYFYVWVVEKLGGSEVFKISVDDDNCRGCIFYFIIICGYVRKLVKIGIIYFYVVDVVLFLGICNIF